MVAKERYAVLRTSRRGFRVVWWEFATFASETDIPAVLRKGAPEAFGGQLDAPRDLLTFAKAGGGYSPEFKLRKTLRYERGRLLGGALKVGEGSNFFDHVL